MQLPQSLILSLTSTIFSFSIVIATIVCVTWNSSYREQLANTLTTTALARRKITKILVYVGYDSMKGIFLTLSQPYLFLLL